jgi:chitodextrinase
VTGYDVFLDGVSKASVAGTEATISGLTAGTEYTVTVKAKDAAGNVSDASAAVKVSTKAPDTAPPTAPGNVRSTAQTDTSVTLAWDASTDNVGVVGYEVRGAGKTTSATGTTATITGLTADTEYSFTVVAKDAAGNVSPASAALTVRTKPAPSQEIPFAFDLTGKTFIKAANGTVPLRGGISVLFNLGTGTFSGDISLDPTQGNFKIFGFIPASAKIEFVQVGKTTGALSSPDLVLTAKSNVTVKLPRVSVFGFPVSASPTCQTSTPAAIPLQSKPGFNPLAGGTLTGTYTLPALKGCGLLTPLISAITAGRGNTIEVNLVPRPAR